MKNKFWLYISFIFFTSIAIFGIYKILVIINQYQTGKETYDNLSEYVNNDSIPQTDISKKENIWPEVDFTSLSLINKDIIGWIRIDNLNIDYPIVQGDDNDYYLNHMADGTYNISGSIFMDYRNSNNLDDKHTIIYGHNMNDGTMFSKLTKYKKQKYYDENPSYILMTKDKNYQVEIIAGYVANVNDPAWRMTFSDDEDFNIWINNTIDKSLFKSNITPTTDDKIITLSTCSNETTDTRFVLIGVLR